MDSTTLLCRTPAGDSELAVPASGLSITQRRILTLLDSPARLGDLAIGQTLDAERLRREASRLVRAGLAAIASAPVEANREAVATVVRLGAPRLARRRLMALLAIITVALVWIGWQYAGKPAPAGASRPSPLPIVANSPIDAPGVSEPTVIATRVLRGESPDRGRDAVKESRPLPAKTPVSPAAADAVQAPAIASKVSTTTPDASPPHAKEPTPPTRAPDAPATVASVTSTTASAPSANAPSTTSPVAPPAAAAPDVIDKLAVAFPAATESAPARSTSPAPPPVPQAAVAAEGSMQLALAAAPAAPVHQAPPRLVPISREAPEFPREAIAQGIEHGSVKARLTIDAQGRVSSVDILDASPHRVFDRAVRYALARWQFEPGAGGRTTTVDVVFKRD